MFVCWSVCVSRNRFFFAATAPQIIRFTSSKDQNVQIPGTVSVTVPRTARFLVNDFG